MGGRSERSGIGALATDLRRHLAGRPAQHGPRVVAIDGWSGSGKTRLADALAPALDAPCVHLDDFVPGWDGLAASVALLVEWVLEPLAAGRPARWRRWDWPAGDWADGWVALPPAELVVVEGCGSGAAAARPWLASLIWIDAPAAERARRLESRPDWPAYEPRAQMWAAQEKALRHGDDLATAADVIVRPVPGDDRRMQATWAT